MDTRFSINFETNYSCDITSLYEDTTTKIRRFKIKIYNKQNFFLFECTEESIRQIIGKQKQISIDLLHELLSDFFNKKSSILYYFIKKQIKVKYGDNFSAKITESVKKPVAGVDKLLIRIDGYMYKNEKHDIWLIFTEQFSLGPSTEEILKEVRYLKEVVKITAEDNAALSRSTTDIEQLIEKINKRNRTQDDNYQKGMRTVDRENEKLKKMIEKNEKERIILEKKIVNTHKELEIVRVDVSILLTNVGRLKDRIHFLLQVLKKSNQDKREITTFNKSVSEKRIKERLKKKYKK